MSIWNTTGDLVCIDESMSIWFNKWTCPGWMFVPRKPHPFGNEYHSKACGVATVMDKIDLVEGKVQLLKSDKSLEGAEKAMMYGIAHREQVV